MKKQILLLILMLLPLAASADDSGSCGENVTYTFEEATGTLTISGTGAMNDYSKTAPWFSYREKILKAIVTDGVTSIGERAFQNCSGLTSVTIPNSVTSIGKYAFDGCSGLTSVNIPNSVTSIGGYAFYGCSGLTSVNIPNSVTTIGLNTFSGCSSLTSITIPNSMTSIGVSAFSGCSSLTSVTIPNSVTSIDENSFSGCSSLTSITIPNSVTSIGVSAFFGCSSLTSVTIPNSVTSIGGNSFSGCSVLASITVESENTVYDSRGNCNAIIETSTNTLIAGCMNTIIPNSVTSIRWGAFYNCDGLNSVSIPNSVTSIGNYAFYGCSSLTSITIPNSVTSIGNSTFYGCSSLTSITIPNSVTSIGESAFYGCSSLTIITSLNPEPPTCTNNSKYDSFEGVDHTIPVYVPQGSVLKYRAAAGWRNFVIYREIGSEDNDVLLTISDGGNGKTQLLVDESKPYFTLLFKADAGWKLHSLTLNGDNVTAEVGDDGKYTTPALTVSSTLTVVYEQSSVQSISAVSASATQVRANAGELIISNTSADVLNATIYHLDGTQVLQQPLINGDTHILLPEGHVYVVIVGSQTFKVGL